MKKITVLGVCIVMLALFASCGSSKQPYIEPIDKVFEAYNSNDISYLKEAVTDDLFNTWNQGPVVNEVNKDSYTVQSEQHVEGDDLSLYEALYNATDCYKVTIKESEYVPDDDSYEENVYTVVVCKIDDNWKIAEFE